MTTQKKKPLPKPTTEKKPNIIDGMVDIIFNGKVKTVTYQLGETLTRKGAAEYV